MAVLVLFLLVLAAVMAVLWWHAKSQRDDMEYRLLLGRNENRGELENARNRTEMLHRMVDGIEDGLFIVDSDMRIAFMNRATQRFFPPVTEPVGRQLIECVRDHRIAELAGGALKAGNPAHEQFLVSSPRDGRALEDRIYSVAIIPLDGHTPATLQRALLVIVRDETDKHMLEKIRKDFVANASHELRTPLSIINGYLENLAEGEIKDHQDILRAYSIMQKHGDRLARIVEDLLVISRMESGEPEAVKKEAFDFTACAQDVVNQLAPLTTSKEARINVVAPRDEDSMVHGDRHYWDQILFNLVSNALKENAAKGLEVTISLTQEPDMSEVRVSDNGVGIPHGDLPFVFKRFYRVARHHSQDIKGTGLGLSIVKRAVEAHQGTITLHSRPGIETVFTMRVPRA
jgi:signal transduction histidine kinase